jgi:integrase
MGDVCGQWLESYVKTARAEKQQQIAAQRVRDYLDPFFGHMMLDRVTREDVRQFRGWLESQTSLSQATVALVLSDVRCMLNWCEDEQRIERSPFPRRIMPRLQEQPPDRLTDEDAARIVALEEPYGFVCRLALGTGLRWGELCRSQAADVKHVRVPGSVEEQWFIEVSNTKSRKVRRVPLSPELVREVRQKVGRLVPFATGSPGSFALRVLRRAGLERFHVHQMRHTFACQWLERGGSLAALQQMLGHASIVTTQRYARLGDEAVMREAARIVRFAP